MKFYNATVRFYDSNVSEENQIICRLETDEEKFLYDNEEYEKLLADTGYSDDNIIYYLMDDEPTCTGKGDFDVWEIHEIDKRQLNTDVKKETAKTLARRIKHAGVPIEDILEEMGYFQHILANGDDLNARVCILIECEDLKIRDGEDEDKTIQKVVDYVLANANLDILNKKTDGMCEADADIMDQAIFDAVKAIEGGAIEDVR